MLISVLFVWLVLILLAVLAHRRPGRPHRAAAALAVAQVKPLLLRLPLAIFAAGFLAPIVPRELIAAWLGGTSGLTGILIATAIGAVLPGGPMVTFPVVIVLFNAGAGLAQTVALLTAWSVLAAHRILAFELPMMGGRFVALRLAASLILPVLAGLLALPFGS
ncbi:MAG: hypothetical protein ACTSRY_02470 [Alphaproteobacteria bacterium]